MGVWPLAVVGQREGLFWALQQLGWSVGLCGCLQPPLSGCLRRFVPLQSWQRPAKRKFKRWNSEKICERSKLEPTNSVINWPTQIIYFISSPGQAWSVTQRSRGFPAPQSCWPARQKREPGSRRARAAGTAARSRGAPSTRCWERTWPYRRWRDKCRDAIYCLPVGGWWCSRHQTCRVKSRSKPGRQLRMVRFVWQISVEFCKTLLGVQMTA